MELLAQTRTAIWAGAAVRLAVALVLFAAPQLFPMRDYEATADADTSLLQRILHRPQLYPIAEDELAYDQLARSILNGDGYVLRQGWVITAAGQPTAYGGALYPLFVAGIYGLTGNAFPAVVLVQILLSVAAVAGVARIAAAVGGDRSAPTAAWLCAVHPGLAMAPSLLMTEALSIPMLVGTVIVAIRWLPSGSWRWAALAGLLVGAGFLLRSPLGLMGVSVVLAVTLIRLHKERNPRPIRHILIAAFTGALLVGPWAVRNWVHFHRILPSDTKSGVNLWMYNRPPGAGGWANTEGMNEGEIDAMYRSRALQNIRDHPGWFARSTLARSVSYWWPVPRSLPTPLHWVGVAVYGTVTLCSALGFVIMMTRPRRGPDWLVVTPFLVGWGLMAVTATGLRHRLTIEPLMVVGATLALIYIVSAARERSAADTLPLS